VINIVEDLIKSFEILNDSVEKKLVSKKIFAEMYDNVDDFKQEQKAAIGFLDKINHFDFNDDNVDDLDVFLMHLHIKISAAAWQLGEVRDVIEIVMGRYRKLVREQGYAKD
jgi:hypothetical protein